MPIKHNHLPKYNIGAHFLTAKTFHGTPYFHYPQLTLFFCEELEAARDKYMFDVLAFVIMPDHVHLLLWWSPDEQPDLTISKIAWAVKGKAARRIVDWFKKNKGQADTGRSEGNQVDAEGNGGDDSNRVGEGNTLAYPELQPVRQAEDKPHHRNWRYRIWQPGAGYDFNVITAQKIREKVVYIHRNPVKAGLVEQPADYPWSSYTHYVGQPALHPVLITNYVKVI